MPLILGRKKSSVPAVPTDIAGAVLWVRGDAGVTLAGGTNLSGWQNQIPAAAGVWGNGAPSAVGRRPTMTTINGRACPSFDGVDDSVDFAFTGVMLPAFTFMVVSKQNVAAAATKCVFDTSRFAAFDFPDQGPQMFQSTTQRQGVQPYGVSTNVVYAFNGTQAIVHAFVMTGVAAVTPTTKRLYANGVQVATVSDATGAGNDRLMVVHRLGARGANNQSFNGQLCEEAVWPFALTAGQVLSQSQGMMSRWGIP